MNLKELVSEAVDRVTLPIDEFRVKYAPDSIEATPIVVGTSLGEVQAEMQRQVAKWGIQNHLSYTKDTVFDVGTMTADDAKLFCDRKATSGTISWTDILAEEVLEANEEAKSGELAKLRTELIQCAAVAMSWVESIDRNKH